MIYLSNKYLTSKQILNLDTFFIMTRPIVYCKYNFHRKKKHEKIYKTKSVNLEMIIIISRSSFMMIERFVI